MIFLLTITIYDILHGPAIANLGKGESAFYSANCYWEQEDEWSYKLDDYMLPSPIATNNLRLFKDGTICIVGRDLKGNYYVVRKQGSQRERAFLVFGKTRVPKPPKP